MDRTRSPACHLRKVPFCCHRIFSPLIALTVSSTVIFPALLLLQKCCGIFRTPALLPSTFPCSGHALQCQAPEIRGLQAPCVYVKEGFVGNTGVMVKGTVTKVTERFTLCLQLLQGQGSLSRVEGKERGACLRGIPRNQKDFDRLVPVPGTDLPRQWILGDHGLFEFKFAVQLPLLSSGGVPFHHLPHD